MQDPTLSTDVLVFNILGESGDVVAVDREDAYTKAAASLVVTIGMNEDGNLTPEVFWKMIDQVTQVAAGWVEAEEPDYAEARSFGRIVTAICQHCNNYGVSFCEGLLVGRMQRGKRVEGCGRRRW